jgi:hypothetical protein
MGDRNDNIQKEAWRLDRSIPFETQKEFDYIRTRRHFTSRNQGMKILITEETRRCREDELKDARAAGAFILYPDLLPEGLPAWLVEESIRTKTPKEKLLVELIERGVEYQA